MTYRDRREARAERLRDWAEKREERAVAVFKANEPFTSDYAFNTQPGHIPVRARIIAQEDRAHESLRKAQSMAARADGIESQLDAAIYDDDPDAVEQLEARIARLEAERTAMRDANAAFRREHKDKMKGLSAYDRHQAMPHQSYELSNLGGRITKDRQRVETVRQRQARQERSEAAGGVVVEERPSGYCGVTFAEKPAVEVRDALKAAGFWFSKGTWWGRTEALPAEFTAQERSQA